MSGPYGTPEPLGIFIQFVDAKGGWIATAVCAEGALPVLDGPTSSHGRHPGDALQTLLEKGFCSFNSESFAPTIVEIEVRTPAELLLRDLAATLADRDRLAN